MSLNVPKVSKKTLRNLTAQQLLFLQSLMADPAMDVAKAAKAAGYAQPATAGHKLLNNKDIQRELKKLIEDRNKRMELSADEALHKLYDILHVDPLDIFEKVGDGYVVKPLEDIPDHVRLCIKKLKAKTRTRTIPGEEGSVETETTIELDLMDKDNALVLWFKHKGLIDAKGNLNISVNGNVTISQLLAEMESEPIDVPSLPAPE